MRSTLHRMNALLGQWYEAQAANGGVIRRSRDDVEHHASVEDVVEDAHERGWHVVETGGSGRAFLPRRPHAHLVQA